MKKYIVLGVLFLLPITAYLFFSSGVNNFAKLPTLTSNVDEVSEVHSTGTTSVRFQGNISVVLFLGSDLKGKFGNIFNLAHKIYKPFYEFEDLQFVLLLDTSSKVFEEELLTELEKISDTKKWKFVYTDATALNVMYRSFETNVPLDKKQSSPLAFILDKEANLRGRDDDKDQGLVYGYDTSSVATLNEKMKDDMKVLLAEYRMELKKNNPKRKI